MPRLAGVNLLGVLLAGVAIYFVGFMWFAVLFDQYWMEVNGYTLEEIETNFSVPIFAVGGIVIPLVLAFALGWLMRVAGIKGLVPAMLFGAKVALLVAAPAFAYDFVYSPNHSVAALVLDITHTLTGLVLGAAVLSFFE